jgi:AcrR family transcriptional regulator
MKSVRIDIAGIRREQIVESAIAVITEQGFQHLSLSEIEKRAGMSRGQLTYYFKSKEDILLAVFDRLVQLTHERIGTPAETDGAQADAWDWIEHLFAKIIGQPPVSPAFGCLQYTFLSQMAHREDFRQRLAALYEEWRSNMAQGLAADMQRQAPLRPASPRAMATLIQALLHGLAMQRAADPDAFNEQEMVDLCLDLLGTFLRSRPRTRNKQAAATKNAMAPASSSRVRRANGQSAAKVVNGERAHSK